MKAKIDIKKLTLFIPLLILSSTAWSAPSLQSLLKESEALGFWKTKPAKEFLSRFLQDSRDLSELGRVLDRSENLVFQNELSLQLEQLSKHVKTVRKAKGKTGTLEEKIVIKSFAEKEFKQSLGLGSTKLDPIPGALNITEKNILPYRDLLNEDLGITATQFKGLKNPNVLSKSYQNFKSFINQLKSCTDNSPPTADASSNEMWYQIQGLIIGQGVTVAGHYFADSGEKKLTLAEMSTDMVVSLVSTFAGAKYFTGAKTWKVRYYRLVTFAEGMNGVDAVIYYFSPYTDTHGEPIGLSTLKREAVEVPWVIPSAVLPTTVYVFFNGLRCLYKDSPVIKLIGPVEFGTRMAVALGSTTVFFKVRSIFTDPNSSKLF